MAIHPFWIPAYAGMTGVCSFPENALALFLLSPAFCPLPPALCSLPSSIPPNNVIVGRLSCR